MRKILLAVAATLVTPLALAQFNTFIEIDGIPGEALEVGYVNQIEVIEWSQGAANLGSAAVTLPFRFTHEVSRASPLLLQAVLTGADLGTVKVRTIRDSPMPGVPAEAFILVDLNAARVVSVKTSVDSEGGRVEEVTLDCSTFTLSYRRQSDSGALLDPVTVNGVCGG